VTGNRDIMGAFANRRWVMLLASFAALVVLSLNALLLCLAVGMEIPGLGG